MNKKIKIEINFDDYDKGIGSIMESIHNTLKGHGPYINSDIVLSTDKPYDGNNFEGDEVQLYIDFNENNIAQHDLINDMTMAATVALLNAIKNIEENN
jgi:hypothetical protein